MHLSYSIITLHPTPGSARMVPPLLATPYARCRPVELAQQPVLIQLFIFAQDKTGERQFAR